MSNRKIIAAILLGAAIVIVSILVSTSQFVISHSRGSTAKYDGFQFNGNPKFNTLLASCERMEAPSLFLKASDGSVYSLADLPESTAKSIFPERFVTDNGNVLYGRVSDSFVEYRNGKLAFVAIRPSSRKLLIGPRRDGPFVELPIDRQVMLDTFGAPLKWQRAPGRQPSA